MVQDEKLEVPGCSLPRYDSSTVPFTVCVNICIQMLATKIDHGSDEMRLPS